MSKIVTGVLGVVALAMSLGAAQLAVGHDLSTTEMVGSHVNRAGKTDRANATPSTSASKIVTEFGDMNTSIVVRVPRADAQPATKYALGKKSLRPVACEAPASVLTEVAKLLESGRCVT